MQDFSTNLFCPVRAVVRLVVLGVMIAVSIPAPLAKAQIASDMPNPIAAPKPLTKTLSIFRLNMQDKITKVAETIPESKYSYRPTKDVRSFGEIVTHRADISYHLCSNMKCEAPPPMANGKTSKAETTASSPSPRPNRC